MALPDPRTLALAGAALALGACRERSPVDPDGTALILVMDGVRLEESLGDDPSSATGEPPSAFLPTVWEERLGVGVRSTEAWSLSATTTVPAHATILTGRRIPLANYATGDDPGVYRSPLPTLAEWIRASDPGVASDDAVLAANTTLLMAVDHSLWPGLGEPYGSGYLWITETPGSAESSHDDSQVLDGLIDQLLLHPVRLGVANLHQVDRSGHYGDDQEHLDRIRGLDRPLSRLWDQLDEHAGYAGDSWVLLTSDHGRHSDAQTDPPWRHHGCACNGCRRVPFLLTGPGVAEGTDAEGPVLLTDYAPTLAALLGVSLPWADGLVRDDLLTEPTGIPSRSGLSDLALTGTLQAEIRYLQDPAHRNELWVEGQRLSDPEAVAVEGLAMASDGREHWLCFREVVLAPEAWETGWVPRCFASDDDGASWEGIGFPVERVGPYWRPDLAGGDGALLVAWAHDPNGLATESWATEESDMGVDLARWDGETWIRASSGGIHSFPQDAALLPSAGGAWVAVGASGTTDDARHHRDIHLGFAELDEAGIHWGTLQPMELQAVAGEPDFWRLEHPALAAGPGGELMLAAAGFVTDGSVAVVATSSDGRSWDRAGAVALPHRLMPHLGPLWLGSRPVWATVDPASQQAWICAGGLDEEPVCVDAGTERILRMVAHQGVLHALIDVDEGRWEQRSWSAEVLGIPDGAP